MTGQQPDIQWYIARDGKQHGPLTDVEMRTFVAQGHLKPTDLIWRPGFADWRPAPAVFPFQPPEPPWPASLAPPTRSNATGRPTGFPSEPSFEPERIRIASRSGLGVVSIIGIVGATTLGILLAVGGGWYVWQNGVGFKISRSEPTNAQLAKDPNALSATATAPLSSSPAAPAAPPALTALQQPLSANPTVPAPSAIEVERTAQELDARFQMTQMWPVVKREFPDWYSEKLREAAKLSTEKQPQIEIAKHLAQGLVELRRKHADQALAASTDKLKLVANAFLDNLKTLSERGIGACFGFISQGETSPAVIEMMLSPTDGKKIQAQVAAIFEAIADGRRSPTTHERAVKADYEVLVQQLTKLGWKENDLRVFSNPQALSREPPGRVCQMVQDWFVAHLSVQDKAAQERLLVETLKPVVSG